MGSFGGNALAVGYADQKVESALKQAALGIGGNGGNDNSSINIS